MANYQTFIITMFLFPFLMLGIGSLFLPLILFFVYGGMIVELFLYDYFMRKLLYYKVRNTHNKSPQPTINDRG